MSILTIAVPAVALPVFEVFAIDVAPPLLGFGLLAVLLMLFKPLLFGLLRAVLVLVKPRRSFQQRLERRVLQRILMLNRMAREVESSQPGLAAELRYIAGRG